LVERMGAADDARALSTGNSGVPAFLRLRRIVVALLGLLATLVAVELVFFAAIMATGDGADEADAVVVFGGAAGRIQTGYRLMRAGRAQYLLISTATPGAAALYDARYGGGDPVRHLYETQARTTLENAVHSGEIIRREGLDSVILVTSRWHMPRAYLMLESQLVGSGVKVYRHAAGDASGADFDSWRSQVFRTHVYRELIELWGSLGELIFFWVNGDLPDQSPKRIAILRELKAMLY
jgi:uncharacterized SAM-binding protein YcdF (DUF218 family)